jgi:hypothetical protein
MKKILTIGLVMVLVLSIGIVSYGHYNTVGGSFSDRQGFGAGMMNEGYYGNNTAIESLTELTDLTADEIYAIGLPLHDIAEEEGVLDAFLEASLNDRIETIEALAENGTVSDGYADLMIDQMTEMNEYMVTDDYLNHGSYMNQPGGFRGSACGRRW